MGVCGSRRLRIPRFSSQSTSYESQRVVEDYNEERKF